MESTNFTIITTSVSIHIVVSECDSSVKIFFKILECIECDMAKELLLILERMEKELTTNRNIHPLGWLKNKLRDVEILPSTSTDDPNTVYVIGNWIHILATYLKAN